MIKTKPNGSNFVFLISWLQVIGSSTFWCLPPIIMGDRHFLVFSLGEDPVPTTQDMKRTNYHVLDFNCITLYYIDLILHQCLANFVGWNMMRKGQFPPLPFLTNLACAIRDSLTETILQTPCLMRREKWSLHGNFYTAFQEIQKFRKTWTTGKKSCLENIWLYDA